MNPPHLGSYTVHSLELQVSSHLLFLSWPHTGKASLCIWKCPPSAFVTPALWGGRQCLGAWLCSVDCRTRAWGLALYIPFQCLWYFKSCLCYYIFVDLIDYYQWVRVCVCVCLCMSWVLCGGQRATLQNGSLLSFHFNVGSGGLNSGL